MPPGPDELKTTRARRVITASLIIAGLIHLVPLSGVLGADRLTALYGLPITDPNLVILMRHRAVLFGLLGVFMVYAAFRQSLRTLGLVAGFVSVLSFFWIAGSVGGYNDSIRGIVAGDVAALVSLVIGAVFHTRSR